MFERKIDLEMVSFFSTVKIKLGGGGGGKNLPGTHESKSKRVKLLMGHQADAFSVPLALTRLTEFSEQRDTMRNWGDPLIDMRGSASGTPCPASCCCPGLRYGLVRSSARGSVQTTGKANAGGEDPSQSESSPACLRGSGAEPNMFQVPEWNS